MNGETKDLEKEPVEQLKFKVGARYIHNKTSNEYVIVSITKMKHPDTGEWIPAVIYQLNSTESLWCRSVESFRWQPFKSRRASTEEYIFKV